VGVHPELATDLFRFWSLLLDEYGLSLFPRKEHQEGLLRLTAPEQGITAANTSGQYDVAIIA
jgi:hypothetical protein